VKYAQKLSARAVKDLDALDNKTRKRMLDRIAELADLPYDPKFSIKLTNQGGLRRSRVGGWRIIFLVSDEAKELSVVTIERRGQVYQRV
jgi:mRNA interferase RelE/StbE